MTERDLDREYRAYQLLRWSTPAPLAEFNEELAAEGFYSRIQKERSDKALDAFEAALPAPPLSELDAFRELEALGVLTQADYYSPAAAKEHEYSRRLTSHRKQPETPQHRRPNDADQHRQPNRNDTTIPEGSTGAGQIRGQGRTRIQRERLASSDEEPISSSEN